MMYGEPIFSAFKSENGFVLKIRVPKKKSDKDEWGPMSEMKAFQFSDKATMLDVLRKSLPDTTNADPEKEMADAFKEAVKDD